MFPPRLAAKPEEREPVPRRAGCLAHGRTQGTVDLATALEAVLPNANDDILTPVAAHQFGTGHREPRVLGRRDARLKRAALVQIRFQELCGSANAEFCVVGDLKCGAARAFREAAVSVRLHAPGDSPEEELFVIRPARFAEDITVQIGRA